MAIYPAAFRRFEVGSPEYMHAHDHRGLKEVREATMERLTAELHALLTPLGYERNGTTWRKVSRFGCSLIQIQRSQPGFSCYINCGVLPPGAAGIPSSLSGTPDGFVLRRLAEFYPDFPRDCRFDALEYVRLAEQTNVIPMLVELLRLRALPWLELRHTPRALVSMPTPADMAQRIALTGEDIEPGPRTAARRRWWTGPLRGR